MSSPFQIDGAARARIALVWRQRMARFGTEKPTASQVATAAETTCWQVQKILGVLVIDDTQQGSGT